MGAGHRVRSLTMLDTPNRGTLMASAKAEADLLLSLFGKPINVGTWDMRVGSNNPGGLLYDLNNAWQQPSTPYRAVAGTRSTIEFDWLGLPNDCVVPESSVRGPFPSQVTVSRSVAHPGLCLSPHLRDAAGACLTEEHVFCDVLDMLVDPVAITSETWISTALVQSSSGASTDPSFLAGVIGPSETDSHTASVDTSVTNASVSLLWDGSPNAIKLRLRRPDGTLVSPGDPGVTYSPPSTMEPRVCRVGFRAGVGKPATRRGTGRLEMP